MSSMPRGATDVEGGWEWKEGCFHLVSTRYVSGSPWREERKRKENQPKQPDTGFC